MLENALFTIIFESFIPLMVKQKRRNRFKYKFETVLLIHTINPN